MPWARIARRRAAAAGRAPSRSKIASACSWAAASPSRQRARLLVGAAEPLPGLGRRSPVAGDLERIGGGDPVRRRAGGAGAPAPEGQLAGQPGVPLLDGDRVGRLGLGQGARRVAGQPGGLGARGAAPARSAGTRPTPAPARAPRPAAARRHASPRRAWRRPSAIRAAQRALLDAACERRTSAAAAAASGQRPR